jgi:hypothetical protein
MAVKAKHSAGGEYSPDWRPNVIHLHPRYRPHDRSRPALTVPPGGAHAPYPGSAPAAPAAR